MRVFCIIIHNLMVSHVYVAQIHLFLECVPPNYLVFIKFEMIFFFPLRPGLI